MKQAIVKLLFGFIPLPERVHKCGY